MAYQSAEFAHTSRATYNAVCCSMNVPMPLVLHALAHADTGGSVTCLTRDLSTRLETITDSVRFVWFTVTRSLGL